MGEITIEEKLKQLIKDAVREVIEESGLTAQQSDSFPEIMDLQQAAELLHYKPSYLRNRKDDLGVPYTCSGRKFMFLKSELLKWAHERQEAKEPKIKIAPVKSNKGITKIV